MLKITQEMKKQLKDLGYEQQAISELTPVKACEIIKSRLCYVAPPPNPFVDRNKILLYALSHQLAMLAKRTPPTPIPKPLHHGHLESEATQPVQAKALAITT